MRTHRHSKRGKGCDHLDEPASQSWPSPRGLWPGRPSTDGLGLLLRGDGLWECGAALASWEYDREELCDTVSVEGDRKGC